MTSAQLDALRRIDPLPAECDPPSVVTLIERLDPSIRSLDAELGSPRAVARPRVPRAAFAGAALAGAAVAATLAVADLGGGGRVDVAAAALRATEPGPGVVHMRVLTERTFSSSTRTVAATREIWTAQRPRRMRVISTDSEGTSEDTLTTEPTRSLAWSSGEPGVVRESFPSGVEFTEASPVATIHRLLAEGRMTLAGRTSFEGRDAWRLDVHPQPAPGVFEGRRLPDPTLLVDARTFAPLELVDLSATTENGKPEVAEQRERFTEYAELPADRADEALLEPAPHPGARIEPQE